MLPAGLEIGFDGSFLEGAVRPRQRRKSSRQRSVASEVSLAQAKIGPPLCADFSEKGCSVSQCRVPLKPLSERHCHGCVLNGHLSWKCPDKPKAAGVLEEQEPEAEPVKPVMMIMMMMVVVVVMIMMVLAT